MVSRDVRHPPRPRQRLAIELRGSLGLIGTLVKWLGLAPLFPAVLAVGYGDPVLPFVVAAAVAGVTGFVLERIGRGAGPVVGTREGYFVVASTWLLAALLGAIPYLLSTDPELSRPMDAVFESMSGFTTTGASILSDVEALDPSLAMWRQFTQWLGGMGIIVLALAVLPRLRVGGRQLLEAELPGPEVDELGSRIRQTARRLWGLYVALTVLQALVLAVFGWTGVDDRMSPFEAVAHAFTTMPTGGFSTEARSIELYAAPTQWVIVAFMVVAGANFALTYRALVRRRVRTVIRDEELRLYAIFLVIGSALLVLVLETEELAGSASAVRTGVFQAVSVLTTTGYATADFNTWTTLALVTIVALMFVGGSAGSTGGSIKVVRHLVLGRALRRETRLAVHPELVEPVRLNGQTVGERTIRAVIAFVLLYVGVFVVGAGVLAVDTAIQGPDVRPIHLIAAAATTLGNVGPALGSAGPEGNFSQFSDISKGTLVALMWMGRLELLPVLVLFTKSYWRG
jgi:trk system potassium uptake protein TrkH